jgi:hypothetical protein
MHSCDAQHTGVHDQEQPVLPNGLAAQDSIFGAVLQALPPGTAPVYSDPPHCNRRGLTDLGRHTIEQLVARHMIVDPDHMSVVARQQSLSVLEALHYPGVVSSHSWATPDAYPRIYALGGMTSPYAGSSESFVRAWRERRAAAGARPGVCFGIGYGGDSNGLGSQGGPRGPGAKNPVAYPFRGFGGTLIDKQRSGQRVYDINVDGVAHYGLYPDWIEDLRHLAGDQIVEDMACGAEAYLDVWERADGIAPTGCRPTNVLDALPAGASIVDVLRAAGQPQRRKGTTFTYCVAGGGSRVLSFTAAGRLVGAQPRAAPREPLPVTGDQVRPVAALALIAAVVAARKTIRAASARRD